MPDLNDWRLAYPGRVLEFGTLATGYPLTKQVDVGAVESRNGDQSHPWADGVLFGLDTAGGRTLTFEAAVSKVHVTTPEKWVPNLDALSTFESVWKAKAIRRRVGAVAELTNLNRGRVVYGRPRNYKEKLDKVRRGWSEFVCDFATVDDLFYGATERTLTIGLAPATQPLFSFPLTFPLTTAGTTTRTDTVHNAGDEDTWPVITFGPPGAPANPTLELLDSNGGVVWRVKLDGPLAGHEAATIDTRPWSRGAWVNGSAASGRLRGDQLDACTIPPGTWQVRYTAQDQAGSSTATIKWRDAHASL